MNFEFFLFLAMLVIAIASLTLPKALLGRKGTNIARLVAFCVFGVATVFPNMYTIDEGHEGVLETFGAAAETPVGPGLKFKMPWQEAFELSMREDNHTETYECSTKDLQEVNITMTTIWRRTPGRSVDIWRGVGDRSLEVDVKPGAGEVLKAVVASYNATDLVRDIEGASGKVKGDMGEWMTPFGITIANCNIASVEFSDNFETAVEDKKQAFEEANTAVNQVEKERQLALQMIADAKGVADGKIKLAEGDAAQITRGADATAYETIRDAEATAARIRDVGRSNAIRLYEMAQQLTPEVVQLDLFEKWRAAGGQVPNVHLAGSSGPGMLIQAPTPGADTATSSNR